MQPKDVEKIKQKIKILVNQADPWYLIELGVPDDEYEEKINRIVSFVINKKPNSPELESELMKIFHTNEFDLEQEKMKILAQEILAI